MWYIFFYFFKNTIVNLFPFFLNFFVNRLGDYFDHSLVNSFSNAFPNQVSSEIFHLVVPSQYFWEFLLFKNSLTYCFVNFFRNLLRNYFRQVILIFFCNFFVIFFLKICFLNSLDSFSAMSLKFPSTSLLLIILVPLKLALQSLLYIFVNLFGNFFSIFLYFFWEIHWKFLGKFFYHLFLKIHSAISVIPLKTDPSLDFFRYFFKNISKKSLDTTITAAADSRCLL